MALSQRLEIRQSQALVMTPQLMQAIKLLQLSSLDLAAYVDVELERNPLLDRASEEGETTAEPETVENNKEFADGTGADPWFGQDLETSRTTIEERLDTNLENVFPDETSSPARPAAGVAEPAGYSEWAGVGAGGRDGEYNLEAFVSAETTLADHLADQLALSIADPARRMIGRHLIDLVDEAGYVTGDIADVAQKLGAPIAEVE